MKHLFLGVALTPYLALAGIDMWMHDRARRVPEPEQAVHAGLAVTMMAFLVAVFADRLTAAVLALIAFLTLLVTDELGFHRGIDPRERRVHVASWLALGGFIVVWQLLGEAL
jgi:hypothetical protein